MITNVFTLDPLTSCHRYHGYVYVVSKSKHSLGWWWRLASVADRAPGRHYGEEPTAWKARTAAIDAIERHIYPHLRRLRG